MIGVMEFTIKKIADLAGVTTRTLRYYDEIDLLKPVRTGENGYRYYNQESLLQLQQILFFRELNVPLKDVQDILSHPGFNLLEALENHRSAIQHKAKQLEKLLSTLDHTI